MGRFAGQRLYVVLIEMWRDLPGEQGPRREARAEIHAVTAPSEEWAREKMVERWADTFPASHGWQYRTVSRPVADDAVIELGQELLRARKGHALSGARRK